MSYLLLISLKEIIISTHNKQIARDDTLAGIGSVKNNFPKKGGFLSWWYGLLWPTNISWINKSTTVHWVYNHSTLCEQVKSTTPLYLRIETDLYKCIRRLALIFKNIADLSSIYQLLQWNMHTLTLYSITERKSLNECKWER